MTLHELATKFGCDKLHSHSYVDFYAELFKDMKVRRILEIGIGYRDLMEPFVPFYVHGASLKMWSEFWPEAEIWGCDIRPETLFSEGNIYTFNMDQTCEDHLARVAAALLPMTQIVIDDGSHEPDSQIFTAKHLLPSMPEGSLYIIEDCREPERVVEALGCGEIHRFNKRADDCLVVIRR